MKIAQVAPLCESVPPRLYGGTERIVSYLTEELVRQGHDVTLFASGDSITSAELVPACPAALRLSDEQRNPVIEHLLMLENLRQRCDEFDIIHFHIDLLQFPIERLLDCPSLTTLHGRLDVPGLFAFYQEFGTAQLVAISHAQRRGLPSKSHASIIYHGLPSNVLSLGAGQGGYLAFLGRISPEKGPVDAIHIAEAAGLPLKIAAKVDRVDADYWHDVVEPLIRQSSRVEYVGEIDEHQKMEFLGSAAGLLFPIDWPEPFGLVMIEAMACGTPVIAYPVGSVPEIVEEGRSGHIVGNREGAVRAVQRIGDLDRRTVRQCFDRRFTVKRMTARYINLYEKLLKSRSANGHIYGPPLAVRNRNIGELSATPI